jgi:hypothetical protein
MHCFSEIEKEDISDIDDFNDGVVECALFFKLLFFTMDEQIFFCL